MFLCWEVYHNYPLEGDNYDIQRLSFLCCIVNVMNQKTLMALTSSITSVVMAAATDTTRCLDVSMEDLISFATRAIKWGFTAKNTTFEFSTTSLLFSVVWQPISYKIRNIKRLILSFYLLAQTQVPQGCKYWYMSHLVTLNLLVTWISFL